MQNIKTGIPKLTDFYFTPSQAEVITGKQEGFYLSFKCFVKHFEITGNYHSLI